MLNSDSLQAVARSHFGKGFCKPLYGSYCASRIPETIFHLLTGKGGETLPKSTFHTGEYESVILFFIDAFGWRFFEKYLDGFPFLKRFIEKGIASKITSQFPSTTAVHVTSMNTGLPVNKSGVYEWFYYEPKVDRMIAPLLYSFAGDKENETLRNAGIDPQSIYPDKSFYQMLSEEGIKSYVIQDKRIIHSTCSSIFFKGAEKVPYNSFSQGVSKLADLLKQQKEGERAYYYLYFADIDSMGHRHGVDSAQFEYAIKRCFDALEELFWKEVQGKKKTACLVTADHGMIAVHPERTIYLNEVFPSIVEYMKKNRAGELLVPAGSCRDFFLHIEENSLGRVKEMLEEGLRGKAEVHLVSELIKDGFFGEGPPAKVFLERVGNLVILPYAEEGVWWHEKHRFEQNFYASHGGLSKEEMETIFLFTEL